jgi:hypothetical protein
VCCEIVQLRIQFIDVELIKYILEKVVYGIRYSSPGHITDFSAIL